MYVIIVKKLFSQFSRTSLGHRKFFKDMRTCYNNRTNLLIEDELPFKCPYAIFEKWLTEAKEDKRIIEPNSMCVATATKSGIPSARYILCKGYDKTGFIFFTHYTSRKGQELEENPNAALTFYWPPIHRSIRVEGKVEKLSSEIADEYFKTRPYDSQIGALCSDQSKPIEGRHVLFEREIELKQKYGEGQVPRPEQWGGYKVIPKCIEFWQGQSDRIHDRIRFRKVTCDNELDGKVLHKGADDWFYERLAP
nr:pyridoxine/pyridoxamine 5'-phosphate oxidase-like isoform X1 [Onthophagus taurus]